MQPGLYIVGTPIGNLSDVSERALDTLRRVDIIAAEDTRVSGKLLSHFDVHSKMIALHEHNERDISEKIVNMIADGKSVALISDSGMPTISDPGFHLVRTMRAQKLPVFVVPGPTALISALVLSGFPTDRFTFCGFLPNGATARENMIRADNKIRHTIIYYESPNRIADTIALCAKIMPERRIAIVREITKIHEETIIGYPAELLNLKELKGEIVLIIEPAPEIKMSDDQINEIVRDVLAGASNTKSAASEIAARTGMSKSDAYARALKQN